jgi:diguanylate cyclase (GGDEF)-like protein
VILTDLDHFKRVNDTHGHMAGDAVLRMTARRILATVRSNDAIGRYGGEEFLVVLSGCGTRCAAASAERLRRCIVKDTLGTPEGMVPVTISLGAAVNGIETRRDATSTFQAADLALYRAKEKGRKRFEVSDAAA